MSAEAVSANRDDAMQFRLSPVVRTAHVFFCAACGECLSQEALDFYTCDACGGDGFDEGDPDDHEDNWPDE